MNVCQLQSTGSEILTLVSWRQSGFLEACGAEARLFDSLENHEAGKLIMPGN